MSQISYISIKDIINEDRMEAEFFCMASKLTSNFIYWKDIIKKVQYWTSDSLNEEKIWYPILRLNEFDWLFIWEPSKYCDLINEKQYKEIQLKKWDVLICRTNWSKEFVGRSAIVMEDQEMWFASYLFRLQPNEKINSETLLVYLNTIPWKQEILKYKMVSNQANFSPAKFNKIKIPNINTDIQQEVSEIVQTAYNKKQKSKQLYQEAEDLLLTELWLKGHTISHTLTFSTTKKAVDEAWRYDADYFQPKYDELIEKIENYKWGWEQLINLTTYINNWNQPPYSENWNIKFFSQKWIKDKWIDYSFLESTEEPMVESSFFDEEKNKPSLVSKWDILYYSVWANLWYCHTYLADEKIAVWSFINIIRTDTSKFDSVAMWVILNSMIWRMQADRDKSWVAQPYIYAKNLRKFKIPLINSQLQKEISDKIKESFKLRNESKELLEQAKKMVEDEIEKE